VTSVDGVRHPEHAAVSQELHRWYNSPVPEIGLDGTPHWFGFTCPTGPGRARLVLSIGDPAQVPGAPAALYRRLGFTDEVYWYSRYELRR
jgi:hypothetical protein